MVSARITGESISGRTTIGRAVREKLLVEPHAGGVVAKAVAPVVVNAADKIAFVICLKVIRAAMTGVKR
jgi:hypothetical protein